MAYVYTPEVYPTILRSVGVGACSGVARAGAMLTPYIAQVGVGIELRGLGHLIIFSIKQIYFSNFINFNLPFVKTLIELRAKDDNETWMLHI